VLRTNFEEIGFRLPESELLEKDLGISLEVVK
jgi:hypothetical protein